jgi:hypothetical protein
MVHFTMSLSSPRHAPGRRAHKGLRITLFGWTLVAYFYKEPMLYDDPRHYNYDEQERYDY